MSTLFPVLPVDRAYYEARVRHFLPPRLIDIHTHVWLSCLRRPEDSGGPRRTVTWPSRVARENPVEELLETYRLLFPDKRVTPLIFGNAAPADDLDGQNRYVANAGRAHRLPALLFATPAWDGAELERRVLAGGFLGIKVYLTFAPPHLSTNEITIYDYLPPHHLEVLNRHGWIAMLHIPRDGRLRDPVNLAHMQEIDRRYPNAKVIVAHVGRAYCPEDVG
ncbi:MAG: amidohydrolase family protein, partial [Armatimonadota bacterium]|nr:amidohydrolase family protein [Armatimonadota bacterium]